MVLVRRMYVCKVVHLSLKALWNVNNMHTTEKSGKYVRCNFRLFVRKVEIVYATIIYVLFCL